MGRPRQDDNQHTARQHERDDCELYAECLNTAAHGGGRNRGGFDSLPCRGCERYKRAKPRSHSGWQKRGDWDPSGRA